MAVRVFYKPNSNSSKKKGPIAKIPYLFEYLGPLRQIKDLYGDSGLNHLFPLVQHPRHGFGFGQAEIIRDNPLLSLLGFCSLTFIKSSYLEVFSNSRTMTIPKC